MQNSVVGLPRFERRLTGPRAAPGTTSSDNSPSLSRMSISGRPSVGSECAKKQSEIPVDTQSILFTNKPTSSISTTPQLDRSSPSKQHRVRFALPENLDFNQRPPPPIAYNDRHLPPYTSSSVPDVEQGDAIESDTNGSSSRFEPELYVDQHPQHYGFNSYFSNKDHSQPFTRRLPSTKQLPIVSAHHTEMKTPSFEPQQDTTSEEDHASGPFSASKQFNRILPMPPAQFSCSGPANRSHLHRSNSEKSCYACGLSLRAGRIITAANKKMHPTCFRCATCSQNLEHVGFFFRDDNFYCHLDYHEQFSPRCKYCTTPIEDRAIHIGNDWFHENHHFCAGCSENFRGNSPCIFRDDLYWCQDCYDNKYAVKCKKCRKPILGVSVNGIDGEYHHDCWNCGVCNRLLGDEGYFIIEDTPICRSCKAISVKFNLQ
ncbi:paxillin-like protein Pxl1 [Schizosaccharomyces cryophilus OY26]|uniref:Paxillin-like protein Pxl1 n=1 Tax=Schizosaccharomyces cryophilus (strain OY26 / ATCC MYA-4695 / CBS 11777 / NBRC 106824 / NRRL Y48691) TaxID=653667 RepID=S9X9R5_SCHCR|nr:paxillin-like protein Pxl1 [Schizosaccharomyces cryophilus OY26]EPY53887.1 paxillin-like protein Pxl1 [Schizosaccharomyces cryophilus OY26]